MIKILHFICVLSLFFASVGYPTCMPETNNFKDELQQLEGTRFIGTVTDVSRGDNYVFWVITVENVAAGSVVIGDKVQVRYSTNLGPCLGSYDTSIEVGQRAEVMGWYSAGQELDLCIDGSINYFIRSYCDMPGIIKYGSPVGSTDDNTPTFTWSTATNAMEYQFQADNNSDYSSPAIDVITPGATYTPSAVLADGTYYWHARGHTVNGSCNVYGSWSLDRTVTISTAPVNAWTLMYYLDGDNKTLSRKTLEAFNELVNATINPNINVVVALDLYDSGDSYYYNIESGGVYNKISIPGVPDNELFMGSRQTLANFITWSRENFPAQHYVLVLDDHGSGLAGGMEDETPPIYPDWMSLSDMGLAVSDGIGEQGKIDVLVMNACLMGMLEDASEFSGLIDYYVASENNSIALADHYSREISGITSTSTPLEVAMKYADEYSKDAKDQVYTVSVADMNKYFGVFFAVGSLADALHASMTANASTINEIAGQVQRFDVNGDLKIDHSSESADVYVDLYDFARLVNEKFSDPTIKNASASVMNNVNQYIVDNHHSGWSLSNWNQDMSNSHGVSIFLPDYPSSFYTGTRYKFADGTTWSISSIQEKMTAASSSGWGPMLVDYIKVQYPNRPDISEPPLPMPKDILLNLFLPFISR